jgi:hypothetical protein
VKAFAAEHGVPVIRFGKDDRKIDVMRPHIDAQDRTDLPGVAAIGVAQEFQNVFAAGRQQGSKRRQLAIARVRSSRVAREITE